ncbi:TonB-dependent receptor [Alkalicaulis satelles]|uniref:TonB-dependent receptor n=2 Tax=Alkalicaulis satelles TaxID=2609175 RepID=A0A5M6ZKQ2_9PROT|nr:TonB-dependent receptor [Alkalicaulis satelles]
MTISAQRRPGSPNFQSGETIMKVSRYLIGAGLAALIVAIDGAEALAQQLDTVTVTAQRREQAVTDVPIAITVLEGQTLNELSIATLDDLQLTVPNFQVTQTGIGTQMFIRGVGTGNDPAFEQSVAQFIDGVSYGRAQLIRAPFFDLERVEVLRGPQSVLFGKNTVAGALSLITAAPTRETTGYVTATWMPEFGDRQVDAAVSGPLSEQLMGRLAVRYYETDGFVSNPNKGRDEPSREQFAIRGSLLFEPNDRFDATLKLEHNRFDSRGREIEVVRDVNTQTLPNGVPLTFANALTGAGLPGAITNSEFNFTRDADSDEFADNTLFNATLTANYDLGFGTLTSVTGYLDYSRDELADLDFTNYFILTGLLSEDYDQFTQEVRVVSRQDQRLRWIAGGFYQSSTLTNNDITGFGPDITNLGFAPLANVGLERRYKTDSTAFALFGELTYDLTDRLRLIGGLRWTTEDKDATRQIAATTNPLGFDAPLVTDPVVLATIQAGLGVELNNPGGGSGHDLSQSRSESRLTPSVTVEFDATDDVMIFASYKEGFKGGGFDVRGNRTAFFEFADETVRTYEAGLRSDLMAGRAQFNATAYFSQYSNLQISQFDGTIGFNVGNAGKTEISGFDIDGRIALTNELSLAAGVSYLDFEYTDFRRGNCAFQETPDGDIVDGVQLCDYTGRRGRFTPEWTGFARLSYDRPVTDTIDFSSVLNVAYTGSHNIHDNLDPLGNVDGYTMVDLRAGFGTERWEVALLARNLLDEKVLTFAANVPFASSVGANTQYAVPLRPRVVGVQASLRF